MTNSQSLPRTAIQLDSHDLLIQLLSQLDTAFAAVGVKIEQLGDGHAISLHGKTVERGLTPSDVYGRAIRVAVTAAQLNAEAKSATHGSSRRSWLETCRRGVAYAALAEHKFATSLLGCEAWEFPTATSMEVTVYLAKDSSDDSGDARFKVNFADASSPVITSVEAPELDDSSSQGEHARERARC